MSVQPKLIIHAGVGSYPKVQATLEQGQKSIYKIVDKVYSLLLSGETSLGAVVHGCRLLEDDPLFNAGTGSVLQLDGKIRMSAALMDGVTERFSGVINVSQVQHPIDLALALQQEKRLDRVLSDYGADKLRHELGIPDYDPCTEYRLEEWKNGSKGIMAQLLALPKGQEDLDARVGTVGVVALDSKGKLAAGTSTGGKGFEQAGRVGDSAMPAGTYATQTAAVSCTGVGEDIIEKSLATRIAVRVTDGLSLKEAFERSFGEAEDKKNERYFGAIGIDATGKIYWKKTRKVDVILAAYHDGEKIGNTLDEFLLG